MNVSSSTEGLEKQAGSRSVVTALSDVASGRAAFIVFLLHTAIAILTLGSRVSGLGVLHPTLLLVTVLWGWWVIAGLPRGLWGAFREPWGRRLAILFACSILSIPFVRWPGSVLREGIPTFVRAASFLYFCTFFCTSWRRLRVFAFVWMGCQAFRVLQPIYLHLASGYWGSAAYMSDGDFMNRLSGAPGDIVNPNGLGFIVASVMPFLYYLAIAQRGRMLRVGSVVLALCLLYGLALTGSRSALVALLIDILLIAWRSRFRFIWLSAIAAGAIVSLHFLSANLVDRYESLVSNDTRNAGTREGRINGTIQDFELGLRRPIFGFGLGTSREANWNVIHSRFIAHDLYDEVLIELGFVGLIIYLSWLKSIVRCVSEGRAMLARAPPTTDGYQFMQSLSSALRVWVPMALIFFLSQYGLRELDWYIAGGMAAALYRLAKALPESDGAHCVP